MERVFLECVVRAALIAAGAGIVMRAMRVKSAAARHAAWAGVVLLMLLLPIWVSWGPKAPIVVLPTLSPVNLLNTDQAPIAAVVAAGAPGERAVATATDWLEIASGVYLVGLCVMLLRLAVGTLRAHTLIRGAVYGDGMLSSASCAAPVTAGWFRPVIILPDDWRTWPQPKLAVVLAHEREHVRRGDPFMQWVALLNRAVFWCYPLAWWLERRLAALSEEACDDAVVASGHDPRSYSEYLLDLARSVSRRGARINVYGQGMTGGSLSQRIRRILDHGQARRMSRTYRVLTVILYLVAAGVFLTGTIHHAQSGRGEWARLSPFTATTVSMNSAVVRFDDANWELVSMNDVSVGQLLEFCRRTYGDWWEKRFSEDPVEVLAEIGHPMAPDETVKLVLKDPLTGRVVTVDRARMTADKRRQLYFARSPRLGIAPRLGILARPGIEQWARLAPFTAVTISTNSAIVRVGHQDYELVSVNGVGIGQLLEFCRGTYGDWWEKRFTEDLVEVLAAAGHPMSPDQTVALVLRDVASGRSVTIDRAPMTAENRRAAFLARRQNLGDRTDLPR